MIKDKSPRVKNILYTYEHKNIKGVLEYLTQAEMIVDPSTWAGKLKHIIEAEQYHSAKQQIELIAYKFVKRDTL